MTTVLSAIEVVALLGVSFWGMSGLISWIVIGPEKGRDTPPEPLPPPTAAEEAWSKAAAELGLAFVRTWGGGNRVTGTLHGFEVDAEVIIAGAPDQEDQPTHCKRLSLTAPKLIDRSIPSWLSIVPRSARLGFSVHSDDEVLTGDADLDRRAQLRGPLFHVLARMDPPGRAAARTLVEAGASMLRGEIRPDHPNSIQDPAAFVATVRSLVSAATTLATPAHRVTPELVVARAASETDPLVAIRCLEAVLFSAEGEAQGPAALQAALHSVHPEVRCFAATKVSLAEGLPVLDRLLDAAAARTDLRVQVLHHLAHADLPLGSRALDGLKRSLADTELRVQRAAVEVVAAAPDASAEEPLRKLGAPADPELARSLARAWGELGGRPAEAALIALLAHASVDVCLEAASSLGEVGGIDAVEPLLALTHGPRHYAARDAIRRIQARLGNVEQGRLALVESPVTTGALSLAGGGELSEVGEVGTSGVQVAIAPRESGHEE